MDNELEKNEQILDENASEDAVACDTEQPEEVPELSEEIPEIPEETSETPAENPQPTEKKKSTFKIVLISVVSTLLVLALTVGLTLWVLDGAGKIDLDSLFVKSEQTDDAGEDEVSDNANVVVGKIGDVELTNGELQVYYKFNLLNLQNSEYGYYLYYYYGIDLTQPLDTLIYDETTGQTWQDLILDNAVNSWHEITAMNLQAKEEGFELNEEQKAYLASIDTQIQEMAASAGYATVEEMIHADIGKNATEEGFRKFMNDEYYYSSYYSYLVEKLAPTQEQIETYFTENEEALAAEGVTKDTYTVDVRHILIQPEGGTLSEDGQTKVYSDDEWNACLQKAEEILNTWKTGEATEDSFAELAKAHSADGNASQGGIYTGVTKGYMVETFDAWIFDAVREYGDVDIVKTQFGYHIMFFVGRQYTWSSHCSQKLLNDSVQYAVDSAKAKYPMEIDYDKIVLG